MPGLEGIHLEPVIQMFSSDSKVLGMTGNCFSFFRLKNYQKKQGRQISKKHSVQQLFKALQELNGECFEEGSVLGSSEENAGNKYRSAALESFTIGEVEIISGVLNHLSLKEISIACRLSQRIVKKQLARIIKDLQLNNISELIQFILKTNGIFNRLAMNTENSVPGKQTHERTWGPALHWN